MRRWTSRRGLEDASQHGVDIRAVYGDLLGLLPHDSERDRYAFRVTKNVSGRGGIGHAHSRPSHQPH
jgi:hypothetical protein